MVSIFIIVNCFKLITGQLHADDTVHNYSNYGSYVFTIATLVQYM